MQDRLLKKPERENHHQGGALGYASRSAPATPDHDALVKLPMTYGWNPTVEGAKRRTPSSPRRMA